MRVLIAVLTLLAVAACSGKNNPTSGTPGALTPNGANNKKAESPNDMGPLPSTSAAPAKAQSQAAPATPAAPAKTGTAPFKAVKKSPKKLQALSPARLKQSNEEAPPPAVINLPEAPLPPFPEVAPPKVVLAPQPQAPQQAVLPVEVLPASKTVVTLVSINNDPGELLSRGYMSAAFEARVCSITGAFSSGSQCYAVFGDGHSEAVDTGNRALLLPFIKHLQEAAKSEAK